jgi:phosphotransferase system enzyme I (PtsI)
MCGEMAGDIKSIPLLLGIGIDAFSMSAASIPKAKMLISKISKKECKILANKALKLQTIDEVNQLVGNFIEKKVK